MTMYYEKSKPSNSSFKLLLLFSAVAALSYVAYELDQRVDARPSTQFSNTSSNNDITNQTLSGHKYQHSDRSTWVSDSLPKSYKAKKGEEIFYWIDDSGQRHYSDIPVSYAEQITLTPNLINLAD